MKAWRTLLAIGSCSLLAAACTVSTGTSDDDDPDIPSGDPFEYDDDAADDDTADDDAADDDTADDDAADDDTADDDTADDDTADDDTADDDTADDDTGDDDTADDDTADDDTATAFMCMPDSAEDECEACVQRADRCCTERAACADAPDGACEAEWTAMKTCMDEKNLDEMPDADPVAVLQECMAEASGAGDDLAVSDELFDLLFCVGQAYMEPEAPAAGADAGAGDAGAAEPPADDLLEGDGLCTFACYGVDTLEPVDVDEGEVDVR